MKSISEWIGIATEGLCDDAKTRVAFEIESHYEDAVDLLQANGKSLPEAQTIALDELGDPKTALRRFRKNHLTQKQLETLADYKKAAQEQPSKLLTFAISILGFMALVGHHEYENLLFVGTLWLACVLIPWIRYVCLRLYPAKSSVQSLIMVSEFFSLPFQMITMLLLLNFSGDQNFYIVPELRWLFSLESWACILVCLFVCARAFYWFRIWQRLQKDKHGHDLSCPNAFQ